MVGKPLEMLKQIAPSVVRVLSVLGRSRSISSFIVLKMLDLSNERPTPRARNEDWGKERWW
jgi:hypothetical protein